MKLDAIIKLIDAGYSKDDILKMDTVLPAEGTKDTETTPAVSADGVKKNLPDDTMQKLLDQNAKMAEQMGRMEKAIYAVNIMGSTGAAEKKSVDDILGSALKEGK